MLNKANRAVIISLLFLIVFALFALSFGETFAATCVNNACSDGRGPCRTDADCGDVLPVKPFSKQVQPRIPTEGLPGFGQLVGMIFTWSLNILGVVVFVMIFYAGFKWFTAAGNTARVNEAKAQITNAVTGAIILFAAWIILYTINPDLVGSTFTLPGVGTSNSDSGGNGGGNYHCVEIGNSSIQKYAGTLRSAMDKVISHNPNDIANAPNTAENAERFLKLVAYELRMSGLKATEQVKNGHDIPSSFHDIIGIWSEGDAAIERYDAISDSGAGNKPISQATYVGFAGHIPLDCTY